MRRFLFVLFVLANSLMIKAQVVSGPMLGPVELRDAKVWYELSPEVRTAELEVSPAEHPEKKRIISYKGELQKEFNPIRFLIGGLEINTSYTYQLIADGKPAGQPGKFTTRDLWQWRKPSAKDWYSPDFSIMTGSCAYFNQPEYDRPGVPYGRDSSIFLAMAKEKAAMMIWLGDNWYTREVDFSEWGMHYRPHIDRAQPVLQPLLRAMPQYATWDDHDYGPNDIGSHFILKEESRQIFMDYWCNPSYGMEGKGIYTQFSYGDVDFFMTDDRWWRSADDQPDSIDGKPNLEKRMLGEEQMRWLENALLFSRASFKIIIVGSQVLNPVSPYDKMRDFSGDFIELMNFLERSKIPGVLFLTGDRHHSEIIKIERPGLYPLYDVTVSPLTSGTHSFGGPEKNNPYRVLGIDQKQNYAIFSFSGNPKERKLTISFRGVDGKEISSWSVNKAELRPLSK